MIDRQVIGFGMEISMYSGRMAVPLHIRRGLGYICIPSPFPVSTGRHSPSLNWESGTTWCGVGFFPLRRTTVVRLLLCEDTFHGFLAVAVIAYCKHGCCAIIVYLFLEYSRYLFLFAFLCAFGFEMATFMQLSLTPLATPHKPPSH